jgi:hypothetical protein
MKKFQSVIAGLLITALLPIAGCSLFSGPKDANPEAILPQDVMGVFAIDHSNTEQVKNMVELWDRIPTTGFGEGFKMGFVEGMNGLAKTMFEDPNNKAIIEGSWKIVLGVKVPADTAKFMAMINAENITFGSEGVEVFVGAKFAEADKVQAILDQLTKDPKEELKFVGDEKNPVWEFPQGEGKMMIVRYGTLYFLATSEAEKQAVIDRIEKQEGFDQSEKFIKNMKLLGEKNLGYAFLDGGVFVPLYKAAMDSLSANIPTGMFDSIKDIWVVFSADADGARFVSKTYLAGTKDVIDKYYPAYQAGLVKKVSGKGVIAYAEQPSLGLYLEDFGKSFAAGYKAEQDKQMADDSEFFVEETPMVEPETPVVETTTTPDTEVPVKRVSRESGYKSTIEPDPNEIVPIEPVITPIVDDTSSLKKSLEEALVDPYDTVLTELAKISELTKDDLKKIFDNPYAFAVSNPGEYVPAISFYLQLDSADIENAKKLVSSAATYADQVLLELDNFLTSSGMKGLVQKEVKIVDGAGIQRVFVDWTKMPTGQLEQMNMATGLNISLIKIELYYGVMADGTFVFAFYPDFTNDYGKEVIADSTYYKEGISRAGEISGRTVAFVRTEPIIALANKYMALAQKAGMLSPDMTSMIQTYMAVASAFNSMFNTDVKNEDGIMQSVYLKIDEVVLSSELQKQIDAAVAASKNAAEAQQKLKEEFDKQEAGLDAPDAAALSAGGSGLLGAGDIPAVVSEATEDTLQPTDSVLPETVPTETKPSGL